MAVTVDIRLREKGSQEAAKSYGRLSQSVQNLNKDFERQLQTNQRLAAVVKAGNAAFERQLASVQKAQKTAFEHNRALEKQAAAVSEVTQETKKYLTAQEAADSLDLTDRLSDEAKATLKLADATKKAAEETEKFSDANRDARQGRGGANIRNVSSLNDRTIGQTIGGLGGLNIPGVQNLRVFADIADVTENLPKLTSEIGALGAAGIASTVALAGVAVVFTVLKKVLDANAETAKRNVEAIEQRIELEEHVLGLSLDAARDELASNQREIDSRRDALRQLDNLRDASREGDNVGKSFLATVEEIGDGLGVNIGALGAYNEAITQNYTELDKAKDSVEALTERITELEAEAAGTGSANRFIAGLEQQLEREMAIIEATNTLTKAGAEERLATLELEQKGQKAVYSRLKERTDQVWQELSEAVDRGADQTDIDRLKAEIVGLQEELDKLPLPMQQTNQQIEDFNNLIIPAIERREAENRAIERMTNLQERAADQAKRAATALDKLASAQQSLADFEGQLATDELNKRREASINAVYDAQLKAIDADIERAKASEKAQQAQQKAVEIQIAANEKVRDANTKFMEQEIERLTEFRKSEQRINDDFAREQRQRLEDLNRELSEASTENDVVAFIQAQKEGSKELARASEGFNIDASRRVEDFNAETERHQTEHTRQLFEIDRQYQEQKLQLQQQAAGAELSLLEQLQAKRAEIIANREASLEQFRQQLEVEAINRRRQALIANMNAAADEYRRLNDMALSSGRIIGSNFMQSIIAGAAQRQQAATAVSNFGRSLRIPSFANGAMEITRPTVAVVGDAKPPYDAERIIPFRRSDGMGLPGSGGVNIDKVEISGNWGSMSPQEIENRLAGGLLKVIRNVRAGATA